MTDNFHVNVTADNVSSHFAEIGTEFQRVANEEILPTAGLIEDAFSTLASSIKSSLSSAARSGEFSFKKLSRAILSDLRRFAIDSFVRQPVKNLFTNALSGVFGGGRANGGFAAAGQSFLVGERGPELFTPSASGHVSPMSAAGVTVNINLPGVTDAQSFRRSQTQIAAALARAVGRGQRNL